MRVRHNGYDNEKEINFSAHSSGEIKRRTKPKSKFNGSVERRIEGLFVQAGRHDWSFSEFVVQLSEVLVVLSILALPASGSR